MQPVPDNHVNGMTIGEVSAGPGTARRIVLDQVVATPSRDGGVVLAGTETRIEVRGDDLNEAARNFYVAMLELQVALEMGFRPPFAKTEDGLNEIRYGVKNRIAAASAPPPDEDDWELEVEFWAGRSPKELNTHRIHMLKDPDNIPF